MEWLVPKFKLAFVAAFIGGPAEPQLPFGPFERIVLQVQEERVGLDRPAPSWNGSCGGTCRRQEHGTRRQAHHR
jgi:hypothetical protein